MTTPFRVFLALAAFALVAACWAGFTSSAQDRTKEEAMKAGPDSQKWEYKILQLEDNEKVDEKLLNKLGGEGWELVSVTATTNPNLSVSYRTFSKRAKR